MAPLAPRDGTAGSVKITTGSHKLRLDELNRRSIDVRYAIDVTETLVFDVDSKLHPSAMIPRAANNRVGGFSTRFPLGVHLKTLFRACCHARLRNVDDVSYIRGKHAEILTVGPDNGVRKPASLRIEGPWIVGFRRIPEGKKGSVDSSLIPRDNRIDCPSKSCRPMNRWVIFRPYNRPKETLIDKHTSLCAGKTR